MDTLDITTLPPPPLDWILDTHYSGFFGILPKEIWDYIFQILKDQHNKYCQDYPTFYTTDLKLNDYIRYIHSRWGWSNPNPNPTRICKIVKITPKYFNFQEVEVNTKTEEDEYYRTVSQKFKKDPWYPKIYKKARFTKSNNQLVPYQAHKFRGNWKDNWHIYSRKYIGPF